MNENLNLVEILKDCPKGEKFWSPLLGDVKFNRIYKDFGERCVIECERKNDVWNFNVDGTITLGNIISPIIMLRPSKDQQNWSKFTAPWLKKERFDPNTLQPFDKVLVRNESYQVWQCDLFSHTKNGGIQFMYRCVSSSHKCCIPYNDNTKHLVGTNEEAPEYYRYWEE